MEQRKLQKGDAPKKEKKAKDTPASSEKSKKKEKVNKEVKSSSKDKKKKKKVNKDED